MARIKNDSVDIMPVPSIAACCDVFLVIWTGLECSALVLYNMLKKPSEDKHVKK